MPGEHSYAFVPAAAGEIALPGPVKPLLRGHLHQWALVVSVVTGGVLIGFAPTGRARAASAIYAAAVCLLYGTSALYHRKTWQTAARAAMKRLDHSMILVLIAGTYTPFALLLLRGTSGTAVLLVVWVGAAVGIGLRMVWITAPRWAVVPPYLVVGWVALFVMPQLLRAGGVVTVALLAVGGLLYTVGAIVYASKRPDPWPAVFGYHEVFHLLTIVAGVIFYVAVSLTVYR
ncbi:MAG: PAQR family membrane homeostasis protein TrhA [Frankiaceae bacterium]